MKKILFVLFAVCGFLPTLYTGEKRKKPSQEALILRKKRQRLQTGEGCLAELCAAFTYRTYRQEQDPCVDFKEEIKNDFLKVLLGAGLLGFHEEAYKTAEKTGDSLYDDKFMKSYVASVGLQVVQQNIAKQSVCHGTCGNHNAKNE